MCSAGKLRMSTGKTTPKCVEQRVLWGGSERVTGSRRKKQGLRRTERMKEPGEGLSR